MTQEYRDISFIKTGETVEILNTTQEKVLYDFCILSTIYKLKTLIFEKQSYNYNPEELTEYIFNSLPYNPLCNPIGYHSSIKDIVNKDLHYQIFLYNPIYKTKMYTDEILNKIKTFPRIYVHSPYVINLCSGLNLQLLVECLQVATYAGCKGVVVHTSHIKGEDEVTSINGLISNVISILPYINKNCPLLIETPAGDKMKVAYKIEDFIQMYNIIYTNGGKDLVKICIDTCHVFGAGYDPFDYIKSIDRSIIGLVHFNDSKAPRGSKQDLHETIGKGLIGYKTMALVGYYCDFYKIDYIIE